MADPRVTSTERAAVEIAGTPATARQLNATATSANVALTATVKRLSIFARGADIRYVIGSGAQTATATSHYIGTNERLTIAVTNPANIAAIRAASTDGVLEITELAEPV